MSRALVALLSTLTLTAMIPSVARADGEPLAWGSARSDRRDDIAALRAPVTAPANWSPELRTALGNAFANGQLHPLHLDEPALRRLSHEQLGQVIEALGANRVQALVRSIPSTSDYMAQRYYLQLSRVFAADPQNFLRAFGTRDFSDEDRRRLLERLRDPDNLESIALVASALGGEHRANALQAVILANVARSTYALNSGARASAIVGAPRHRRAQEVMVAAMARAGSDPTLDMARWAASGAFPGRTLAERRNALHDFLNRPQAAGLAADFFARNPRQAASWLGNLGTDQLRAFMGTLGTTRSNAAALRVDPGDAARGRSRHGTARPCAVRADRALLRLLRSLAATAGGRIGNGAGHRDRGHAGGSAPPTSAPPTSAPPAVT